MPSEVTWKNNQMGFLLHLAILPKQTSELFHPNFTSVSSPPPEETVPWTVFTQTVLAAPEPSPAHSQATFLCSSCQLTPCWYNASKHQKKKHLKYRQMKLQKIFMECTDWNMFRDAATHENHTKLKESVTHTCDTATNNYFYYWLICRLFSQLIFYHVRMKGKITLTINHKTVDYFLSIY